MDLDFLFHDDKLCKIIWAILILEEETGKKQFYIKDVISKVDHLGIEKDRFNSNCFMLTNCKKMQISRDETCKLNFTSEEKAEFRKKFTRPITKDMFFIFESLCTDINNFQDHLIYCALNDVIDSFKAEVPPSEYARYMRRGDKYYSAYKGLTTEIDPKNKQFMEVTWIPYLLANQIEHGGYDVDSGGFKFKD